MLYRFVVLFFLLMTASALLGQDRIQLVGEEEKLVVIKKFDNKTVTYYLFDDDQQTLVTQPMDQVISMTKARDKTLEAKWSKEKKVKKSLYLEAIGGVGVGNISFDIGRRISKKAFFSARVGVVILSPSAYAGLYELHVLSRRKTGFMKSGLGLVFSDRQQLYGMLLDVGYRYIPPQSKGLFLQVSFTPIFYQDKANFLPFGIAAGFEF